MIRLAEAVFIGNTLSVGVTFFAFEAVSKLKLRRLKAKLVGKYSSGGTDLEAQIARIKATTVGEGSSAGAGGF